MTKAALRQIAKNIRSVSQMSDGQISQELEKLR